MEATLLPHGLDAAATYEFRDIDTNEVISLSGKACQEQGLHVAIQDKSAARVLIYKKQ